MKLASITEAQLIFFKKKVTPAEGERERKFENLAAKRKNNRGPLAPRGKRKEILRKEKGLWPKKKVIKPNRSLFYIKKDIFAFMKKYILLLLTALCTITAHAQLNKPYFYTRGRDYIIEGNYRQAIESLNILLRADAKNYEGFFLRGVAKYNLDDLPGADADFTRAIEENQVYTQALQYRAITRSRMGQYNEALSDFARAIELRPSHSPSYYSRGVTFFLNQQFAKSIEDFNQFLKIEPKETDGYINRGTSYLYLKDTTQALKNYNRAIEINPYKEDAYLRRGLVALMQKRYDDCVKDMGKTIELDSTYSIAYFYRALAFSNEDKLMLALSDFDHAIKFDSTNSLSYFNRAILRSQIGDYNRAIEDYDQVAKYNPNNVLVFYNRASLYTHLGNIHGAIADYTRAIELYPDFANAYIYRSHLRGALQDFTGARNDMNIAQGKIEEYRSKLTDGTFSIYADTSQQFNRLLSFDADFGNKEFRKDVTGDQRQIKLLPMFRFTFAQQDSTAKLNPYKYRNARLDRFYEDSRIENIALVNNLTELSDTQVEELDWNNEKPERWGDIFSKGISQSLLRQYSSAMNYYSYLVTDRPKDPFAYINRSVTQAEMIEFIASLDGDYQNITMNSDPATRLKMAERRKYDYTSAIADLQKAAELMPELPYIYYNLGNLLCLNGDMPGAIQQYDKAIGLFPYFGEAYYNRGLVQIYLNEMQTGCMDLSKAGELGIGQAYSVVKQYCIKK